MKKVEYAGLKSKHENSAREEEMIGLRWEADQVKSPEKCENVDKSRDTPIGVRRKVKVVTPQVRFTLGTEPECHWSRLGRLT